MSAVVSVVAGLAALGSAAFGVYLTAGFRRHGIDPEKRSYAIFLGAGIVLAFLYAALLGWSAVLGQLRPVLLFVTVVNVGVAGFVYRLYAANATAD